MMFLDEIFVDATIAQREKCWEQPAFADQLSLGAGNRCIWSCDS